MKPTNCLAAAHRYQSVGVMRDLPNSANVSMAGAVPPTQLKSGTGVAASLPGLKQNLQSIKS